VTLPLYLRDFSSQNAKSRLAIQTDNEPVSLL
jgi:hypothetical protein